MNKKILELATHSAMLIDIIDEIQANTKIVKEIKEKSLELQLLLEPLVAEVYKNPVYKRFNILQDLSRKFEYITSKVFIDFEKKINK